MNLLNLQNPEELKELKLRLSKQSNILSENIYKVVSCQNCGKSNSFSYKSLYEKSKVGRKIIKKCSKCNSSIIIKREDNLGV